MELGQYQIQIFLSLVVILGAAFVALICDLLKGNNEQLRELAIELKVRREEEDKRHQMFSPRMIPALATAGVTVPAPASSLRSEAPVRGREERKRVIAPEALAAMQRGAQLALAPKPRQATEVSEPAPAPVEAPCASRDWSSLLSTPRPAPPPRRKSKKTLEPVVAGLPSGFQHVSVLARLRESRQPVTGLVVSIGATGLQSNDGALEDSIRLLIQSFLGANDFATQSSKEEFLLICPGEQGASAQRKLSEIAEQLWDFQLRSMGALSVIFSWGGVEVRNEKLDEAIASATERMEETRRGRKILTMESRPQTLAPLRRAANA